MTDALFEMDDLNCLHCGRALTAGKCPWCDNPTDPKTLARKGDPDTSHAAAHSVNATQLEQMVYWNIEEAGPRGLTQDELLALHPGLSYSSITARPAALKAKGLIGYNGEKRKGASGRGQRVLVAAKFLTSETDDPASDNPVTVPADAPPNTYSVCGTCGGVNGGHYPGCSTRIR